MVPNLHISRSAAFPLRIYGGASCTTFFLFCNSRFNAVDASFSIFYFGACPAFSNVPYKTSYARNMFASLLVFVGSTKIVFFSYACNNSPIAGECEASS